MTMSVIDDYLAKVSASQKAQLERIRRIVKQIVPDVEETIGYGIPAFKCQNQPLVYFAAFKNHMSLFPTAGPTEVLKDKLQAYKISKGTIQFTLENPLPESIIREIIQIRLAEISKS